MSARWGEMRLAVARFTTALPPGAARHKHPQRHRNEEGRMIHDELRELEKTRRRALWALASLHPGSAQASEPIAILDDLDAQERSSAPATSTPAGLKEVRDFVQAHHHHSGIDIVLEHDIPQPWRERFLQASTGSTRLADGPYATDWEKFLDEWEREMQHLHNHRAAQAARG